MLFLLRLTDRKYALSEPMNGGPHSRVSSPVLGRSILITSAPRSPKIIEQNGPVRIREASIILSPASGPVSVYTDRHNGLREWYERLFIVSGRFPYSLAESFLLQRGSQGIR